MTVAARPSIADSAVPNPVEVACGADARDAMEDAFALPELPFGLRRQREGPRGRASILLFDDRESRRTAALIDAPPQMLLLATFAALLGRYSRADRLLLPCFLSPTLGSPWRWLRIDVSGRSGLAGLLKNLRVILDETPSAGATPDPAIARRVAFSFGRGRDVELVVAADKGGGAIEYDSSLFEASAVERMASHFRTLLAAMVATPNAPVARLPIVSGAERTMLLVGKNQTEAPFSRDACLSHLFERRARQAAGSLALIAPGVEMTYAELDRRANRLAHLLRRRGVRPEDRVGIALDRSPQLVVAILGVLMAGGAYLPLDPDYPHDRLRFMLADAAAHTLVTTRPILGRLPKTNVPILCIDAEDNSGHDPEDYTGVDSDLCPENLAYVIYTSGSTGRPKGIAVRHVGVVNNLEDLNRRGRVGPGDRTIAVSSPSFDMSVYEILGTLAAGATVVLPEPSRRPNPEHWCGLVTGLGVTIWNSAPPLLEMFVSHCERAALRPSSLRVALLGGDWVPLSLPDRLRALAPAVNVVSLGGATEASIHSTIFSVDRVDPNWRSIPYGRPMANQRTYVLDRDMEPVPVGVPGELYLGGIGLARGYLHRPDLTAERFVPDPFSKQPGDRLYRTGDLARCMPQGEIELLGRIDHQVKIRGQRIEPREIVAVLKDHPAVRDAVVTAQTADGGDKRLVAYVVAEHVADTHAARISRWRSIYDETYSGEESGFAGWIDSYERAPFPEEQLLEMIDSTVDQILAGRPKRLLEIGCGSGLVLRRLVPECVAVHATDISPVTVSRLTEEFRAMKHVVLEVREAVDFRGLAARSLDTVVLNSVTQHFPDTEYLLRVLEGAVGVLGTGGRVFVGDVRSLWHLEAFHASVEEHRASDDTPIPLLRDRIAHATRWERELFIDPAFFAAVRSRLPRVRRVAIRMKRGSHHNEFTKFHYDLTFFLDLADATQAHTDWVEWGEQVTVRSLRDRLRLGPELLAVRGVPNARLAREVQILTRLSADPPPDTVGELRSVLRGGEGVDPEELRALGEEFSFSVETCWSGRDRPGFFDVVYWRGRGPADGRDAALPPPFPAETDADSPSGGFGNEPWQQESAAELRAELREHLRRALPEPMVPSALVFLDALPLSPNGKVDRRALPPPRPERAGTGVGYVEPVRPTERAIATIWAEVLGLERVGLDDDFFQLGGHSLTATQIMARITERLQVGAPVRLLFERPRLAEFAAAVEQAGREAGIEVETIAGILLEIDRLSEEQVRDLLQARDG